MKSKIFKFFIKIVIYAIIMCSIIIIYNIISNFRSRMKQHVTFVNMLMPAFKIDVNLEREGYLTNEEAYRIIKSSGFSKDKWGNDLIFIGIGEKGNYHYVLISKGSNGKLDLEKIEDYFILPNMRIVDMPAFDIVIRDGVYVTDAGK